MKKSFVRFLSPGTFLAEETIKEIDSWDVDKAMEMARSIKERYSATPYAFQFLVRERQDDDLDSKVTERSNFYFLGGSVYTLDEVREVFPNETILISNMEINGWERLIVNDNSWRTFQPLYPDDVVLDFVL